MDTNLKVGLTPSPDNPVSPPDAPVRLESSTMASTSGDLLGVCRASIDAVVAVTNIVEAMHQTVGTIGGLLPAAQKTKTSGITGLVYSSIRGISRAVGTTLDLALTRLEKQLGSYTATPEREAVLAALNGVVGDYLAETGNPLEIKMQFRLKGQALGQDELAGLLRAYRGRVVVMLHGLCMNDLQWQQEGADYGSRLSEKHSCLVLYLHYNTGKHISDNGKALSGLLESLIDLSDETLSLNIVAHSMGGLVARSAYYYGAEQGRAWPEHLSSMVFLGTPHLGAVLEQGGNLFEGLLGLTPYSAPFATLARLRSSGVTDLRHGSILEEDWAGKDVYRFNSMSCTPVPLPSGPACYAIAGTLKRDGGYIRDQVLGDGLVSVSSALGGRDKGSTNIGFDPEHQSLVRGVDHMALMHHPKVFQLIDQAITDALG